MERETLRSRLIYEPKVLNFGTSGRRGNVTDLTQLEIYIDALSELEYLQSLPASDGGISRGEEFFLAYDLRPSSSKFVEDQEGRGEIAQAIEQAIRDAGMHPVNLGRIPTPTLTCYALSQHKGSMMVTGSHIPFERNGYKTNTSVGELLKKDETPITNRVREVRERIYNQPFADSLFDERGLFKAGHQELGLERGEGRSAYIERYASFFGGEDLRGKRLLVYQHSAVGRDLLVEILRGLGAEAIPAGRSETFVPIDTENIDAAQLERVQELADEAAAAYGPLDAVVSTDGDSDRPLILGVDRATGKARFHGGDLVGMIVAEYLRADAVVVPISCNDAIDRGKLKGILEQKTRIGSPYVIAGMEKARSKGKRAVCGWEANGGFLTGSDIKRNGKVLRALPTRDAFLPILSVLFTAQEQRVPVSKLFQRLPKRFSRATLLRRFPRAVGLNIVEQFSPSDENITEVTFSGDGLALRDSEGSPLPASEATRRELDNVRSRLSSFFTAQRGFGGIAGLNFVDGVRLIFTNGDVVHVRPSGNADELRIYAVADTQSRADNIAQMGIAEPDGILREMEKALRN